MMDTQAHSRGANAGATGRAAALRDGVCAKTGGARIPCALVVAAIAAMLLSACADPQLEPPRVNAASLYGDDDSGGFLATLSSRIDRALRPAPISRAEQQRLGDSLAGLMLERLKTSDDTARRARVARVMKRLRDADTSGFHWRVHIIEDERPNAFTTGGGHLFVTTGMMDVLPADGQLATVLAHEMAHNWLAHVVLAREKKRLARNAHRFSREVLEKQLKMAWLGKSLSFIVNTSLNTYSRAQEDEADADGMDLLVRAGWPPQVVLETFDRMRRVYRDGPEFTNFFYGNHPSYRARRWHIVNLIRAHYRAQAGLPPPAPPNFGPRRRAAETADAGPAHGEDVPRRTTANASAEVGAGLW